VKDDGPEFDLGSLPEEIAEVQRSAVDSPGRLRHTRARLLVSLQNRRATARRRVRAWPLAVAAALAIAAAAITAFILVRERNLHFEVGDAGDRGEAGALVRAPVNAALPVRFSDGTLLSAGPGSGLKIAEVRAQGAVVVLEHGTLEASVVHRESSRWRVQAGPYAVVVTGTRFVVRWNASERSFAVQLHEGSVTVFGPTFGDQGRPLAAGQSLEAIDRAPVAHAPSAHVAAAASVPPGGGKPSTPSTPARAAPSSAVAPAEAAKPSWRDLALAGQHRLAFVAAEAEGFAAICGAASPADLLLLGNTARFAQEPRRAREAFSALRARKDGRYQRAVAAFELGRLAHDQFRAYSEAASWFERYLAEEPDGALVREAAGRLVEARHKAGDRAGARRAAQVYRERYPDGPHDKLARALLGP
jgi:transmembrane sensor